MLTSDSGLGLGIGCRLIDEFLQTRPQDQSLVLITTTRDVKKGAETVEYLHKHLLKTCTKLEKSVPGISMLLRRRVHIHPEIVELTSLTSVQKLCKRLRNTIPRLDAIICNAGIGGWEDLNWGKAVWTILTDWVNAVTWPTFKLAGVGWVTKPQIRATKAGKKIKEPPLGEVFCANFFGHYLLGHYLAPLLAKHGMGDKAKGRIIWVSSTEAYAHSLDLNDIQAIKSTTPYESTKYQADVMAITSTLPSTAHLVDQYFDLADDSDGEPRIYVAHPGICGTTIFSLNVILEYLMLTAFYVARFLGSQWHAITVYKGACAMVWLALAEQGMLDVMEAREGVAKWGSATDFWGQERVERTEVEGWGWGGKVGEWSKRKGRSPYAKDLTEDDKKKFEETGKKCWEEMEKLRIEWEKRLEDAGVGVNME